MAALCEARGAQVTKAEFRSAVSLGLGRAVLQVNGKLPKAFGEVVLDACLHFHGLDARVEGTRAVYMLDLVRRTEKASFYIRKVVFAFEEYPYECDAAQRFEFARLLASEGDAVARKAMYGAFARSSWWLKQGDFALELLALDGISGLIHAAEEIGKGLINGEGSEVDDWLQSVAESELGEETARSALRASPSKNVAAYVEAVEMHRRRWNQSEPPDFTGLSYEQLKAHIEAGRPANDFVKWGQHAADADIELAAGAAARESDKKKLQRLLCLFEKRRFPGDSALLLELAASPDIVVQLQALRALGNVTSDTVRGFAISLIESSAKRRHSALVMLAKNFREGDHEYLLHWVERETNSSMFVGSVLDIRELFQNHPNEAIESRILTVLYERIACAHCRCDVVERLVQLNSLTPLQRAECAWDSFDETRALVA